MDSTQELQVQRKREPEKKTKQRTKSGPMDSKPELQVQRKRELGKDEEATLPARAFLPVADIYETQDALKVILEMPGVEKDKVDVRVEDGVLNIEGRLDLAKYQGLQPIYTEYNIGHYARSFRLSNKIDHEKIGAELKDGVLSLTLPKVREAKPRTIQVV
jgi:HSP20 family protein